jgi:hypothetical protein
MTQPAPMWPSSTAATAPRPQQPRPRAAAVNRQAHDRGLKAQARQVYEAHGAARASEVTGVAARTIRRWAAAERWPRQMATRQRPDLRVAPVAPVGDAGEATSKSASGHGGWQPWLLLERLAGELWAELDELASLRARGKARDARDVAVVVGILVQRGAELAKVTGHEHGGHPDPAAAVQRIRSILDAIEQRRAAG